MGTFIFSNGKEVETKAVSPLLLQKVNESTPLPKPPTYTTVTVAGVEETHDHDETTIGEEDRAVWNQYLVDLEEAKVLVQERRMNIFFSRGLQFSVPEAGEPGGEWIEEQEYAGIVVPENRVARKVHYVETELISTLKDIPGLMNAIMKESGVSQEVIDTAGASFRAAVEETQDGQGDTPEGDQS